MFLLWTVSYARRPQRNALAMSCLKFTRGYCPLQSSMYLLGGSILMSRSSKLLGPRRRRELNGRLPAGEKLRAIAPYAVRGVAGRDCCRVTSPGVLGKPDFLDRGAAVERRKRRPRT